MLDHGAEVKGTGALIAAAEHGNSAAVRMFLEIQIMDVEEVEV